MIKDGFYKVKEVEEKCNHRDLVTQFDKAVEKMVMESVGDTFPEHW